MQREPIAATISPAPAFLADLAGAGAVVTDPDVLAGYSSDQAPRGPVAVGRPSLMVRPTSTAEVQQAIRAAGRHRVPVVTRGAGSGLSGGANAIDGCMILCLERMNRVLDVDLEAATITGQAGVLNADLDAAAHDVGLWYPPDPASREFSTIGGNVATNAGGMCCVKYGVTRDCLLELEVVLADGSVARVGRRTMKDVSGYDLVGLLCGSEGTLGVITEVTARLLRPPSAAVTLAATFTSLSEAGTAVASITRETRPSLLELMDGTTVAAVEEMEPMDFDPDLAAVLFAASDAGGDVAAAEIATIERLCEQAGASLVVSSSDPAEGRMLMTGRRLAYPALERKGTTLLDDVGVPLPAMVALLTGIERIAEKEGVEIGCFGHAGDGNMHPTIVYDGSDIDQVERARSAFRAIVHLALSLGGTISGEHGVGMLKREFLQLDQSGSRELNQKIRNALDPACLLNPGKSI
jgi:glycolate oxidase